MNKLPQHVLDLISQFNPDHREQMNNVLEDIVARENVCDGCYEPILLQEEKKDPKYFERLMKAQTENLIVKRE